MPADLVTDAPPVVRVPPDPMAILAHMVERGVEPDKLEKYLDFVERVAARQAAERFAEALAGCQAEFPAVLKWRQGDKAKFAALDDVMEAVGPVLARHRVAVTFNTEHVHIPRPGVAAPPPDGADPKAKSAAVGGAKGTALPEWWVRCTMRTRVGSHYEDQTFLVAAPADMFVNDSQKCGAMLSYARRYSIITGFNLVMTDQDTDANFPHVTITPEEIGQLNALIELKKANVKRIVAWAAEKCKRNLVDLGDMPRALFAETVSYLKQKATP